MEILQKHIMKSNIMCLSITTVKCLLLGWGRAHYMKVITGGGVVTKHFTPTSVKVLQ